MATVSTSSARKDFSTTVNRAAFGKERVILTRRGRALAALVPAEDLALIERLEDRLDAQELRDAMAEGGETIPWSEAKRRLTHRSK